jgi:DNA-binding SARP family transcriptional activator
MMEFKVLGHLEVLRDGRRLELGGPKQRAVLALLLLHAGRVVSIDRLCHQLWVGEPSPRHHGTLHAYVSHLRRLLEPGRRAGTTQHLLLTRGSGYLLQIDPGQVDAWRFERLVEQGRRAVVAGEFERAEDLLGSAFVLWRGPALADFAYELFAEAEAARLEELRMAAVEDRMDAALGRGRHVTAVAELEQLVKSHPLRERLYGQLMLALYRSGRQAEALRTYQSIRRELREELDAEPGPALKVRLYEEDSQHGALPGPPQRNGLALAEHLEVTKDPEIQSHLDVRQPARLYARAQA